MVSGTLPAGDAYHCSKVDRNGSIRDGGSRLREALGISWWPRDLLSLHKTLACTLVSRRLDDARGGFAPVLRTQPHTTADESVLRRNEAVASEFQRPVRMHLVFVHERNRKLASAVAHARTSAFAVIRASVLVRRLTAAFQPFARQPVSNDRSRRPPMRTRDPNQSVNRWQKRSFVPQSIARAPALFAETASSSDTSADHAYIAN